MVVALLSKFFRAVEMGVTTLSPGVFHSTNHSEEMLHRVWTLFVKHCLGQAEEEKSLLLRAMSTSFFRAALSPPAPLSQAWEKGVG